MARVYMWPSSVYATKMRYGDPTLVRHTTEWLGAPGQKVEHQQRTTLDVEGEIWQEVAPDFDLLMDRLSGGLTFFGFIHLGMRAQFGWDMDPALNSSGAEFWRANGKTATYAGESDNAPTGPWRTVNATCNGGASAGSTSLPVTGLLDGEVIPKGDMIRVGDYRHWVAAEVTANASGEATLTLARPLRAAVSNGAVVQIPGDLFVGSLVGRPDISAVDHRGIRTYSMTFREVYEDEATGSPAFDWQVS